MFSSVDGGPGVGGWSGWPRRGPGRDRGYPRRAGGGKAKAGRRGGRRGRKCLRFLPTGRTGAFQRGPLFSNLPPGCAIWREPVPGRSRRSAGRRAGRPSPGSGAGRRRTGRRAGARVWARCPRASVGFAGPSLRPGEAGEEFARRRRRLSWPVAFFAGRTGPRAGRPPCGRAGRRRCPRNRRSKHVAGPVGGSGACAASRAAAKARPGPGLVAPVTGQQALEPRAGQQDVILRGPPGGRRNRPGRAPRRREVARPDGQLQP